MSSKQKPDNNTQRHPLVDAKRYLNRIYDKVKARGLIRLSEDEAEMIKNLDEVFVQLELLAESQKEEASALARERSAKIALEAEVLGLKIASKLQKNVSASLNMAQSLLGRILYSERFIDPSIRSEIQATIEKIKSS